MALDVSKLENVVHKDGKNTARCPACAEDGQDTKGEHLVIYPSGKFDCIRFSGEQGKEHRKKIYKLVGERGESRSGFNVKIKPDFCTRQIIQKDILGRLGRVSSIYMNNDKKKKEEVNNIKGHSETRPKRPSQSSLDKEWEKFFS